MDLLEFFMICLFFIVLYWTFVDEFIISNNSCELFNSNNKNSCKFKKGVWYPFDPSAYYGYWGFQPYKGLWGHINPWWYYPYPYPTPINYQTDSCINK